VDEGTSAQHVLLPAEQLALELLGEDCHVQEILESLYERQDLDQLARNQMHLNEMEQQKLAAFSRKHASQFSGTLDKWPDTQISLELLPDAELYHCGRPIRVPRIHLQLAYWNKYTKEMQVHL